MLTTIFFSLVAAALCILHLHMVVCRYYPGWFVYLFIRLFVALFVVRLACGFVPVCLGAANN